MVKTKCSTCGGITEVKENKFKRNDNNFCNRDCYLLFHKNNKSINCDKCGKCFKRSKSKIQDGHNFCNRKCYLEFHQSKQQYICYQCSESFERVPSSINGERTFCSQSCRGKWMSEERRGEDSWNWKGGTDKRTTDAKYKEWRRDVLKRDDFICQDCKKRGGELTAHHIERWSECPNQRYNIDNGVTLCYACHAERHKGEKVYASLLSRA